MQHKDDISQTFLYSFLNGVAVLSQDPACSLQATHGQRLETDNSYHVETASSLLASFPAFPAFQAVLSQRPSMLNA